MLLFSDGFEWLPAGTSSTSVTGTKYENVTGSSIRNPGRITGYSAYVASGELIKRFNLQSRVYVGAAVKPRSSSGKIFSLKNGTGSEQCYLFRSTSGHLAIIGLATTVLPEVFQNDTWRYIEWMVDFNGSTTSNSYEVRLDGITVASGTTDLTVTGTANCGGVGINVHQFDDFYITNDSGDAYNDFRGFLGPIRINTLFPIGSGLQTDYQNEKGLVSPNNWASLSGGYDGDTSFVEGSGNNRTDLYQLQDLPDMSIIKGVNISTVARFVDSPYGYYSNHLSKSDGSLILTPGSGNIGSSYSTTSHPLTSNLSSNPWTVSDINDLQIGTRITV